MHRKPRRIPDVGDNGCDECIYFLIHKALKLENSSSHFHSKMCVDPEMYVKVVRYENIEAELSRVL